MSEQWTVMRLVYCSVIVLSIYLSHTLYKLACKLHYRSLSNYQIQRLYVTIGGSGGILQAGTQAASIAYPR